MTSSPETVFDRYGEDYDDALAQGISLSGEDKSYFARGRIAWLSDCLGALGMRPRSAMDYGCGTGSASPLLFEILGVDSLVGVDVSTVSLEIARRRFGSDRARFVSLAEHEPRQDVDLAFCNGIFHHIPPAERPGAVSHILRSLRPGGLLAFWENNPWNPGTRWVMRRIPFDRDAVTLTPPEAKRMLRDAGFEVLRTDFLFLFPRPLRWLRSIEWCAARLPFGAQYQVLCRKYAR